MSTIVDQTGSVITASSFGRGSQGGELEYVGQTFQAADPFLDSISFDIKNIGNQNSTMFYRLLVVSVAPSSDGFRPGSVLFESAELQAPLSPGPTYQNVTVSTNGLSLIKGQTYAFVLEATSGAGFFGLKMSHWAPDGGTDYAPGHMVALNANLALNRTQNFASDWGDYNGIEDPNFLPDADLSFKLVFHPVPAGTAGPDRIVGSGGPDIIRGGAGNDTLIGNAGNDVLIGGLGRDIMTGGGGDDDFDFNLVGETGRTAATRDRITDFVHGHDDIDLSTIDANGTAAGNAAFKFLAGNGTAFTGVRGQVHWFQSNVAGTANDKTIIEGDINGDRVADFQIELTGLKALSAIDFIL